MGTDFFCYRQRGFLALNIRQQDYKFISYNAMCAAFTC
jgi:hypothetical protein